MRKPYYLCITVGPILETLNMADSPVALWYASTMFSNLVARLCRSLREELSYTILTPNAPEELELDDECHSTDGVGRFHDRIICWGQTEELTKARTAVEDCIARTKKAVAEEVYAALEEAYQPALEAYMQVQYVMLPQERVDSGNPILATARYMDALELCPSVQAIADDNPLFRLFAKNNTLKNAPMFRAVAEKDCLSGRDGRIRSIAQIAGVSGSPKKFSRYFALVQADGDAMGRVLQNKADIEKTRDFSRACMGYAGQAAQQVRRFGGMPIYAGGDDILFLAPVVNGENKTVFQLCREIDALYQDMLNDPGAQERTTLSFGISIQYYKFPLYEALERGRNLLFGEAKSYENTQSQKHCMAIHLEKHSGQSAGLKLDIGKLDAFLSLVSQEQGDVMGEELLHSAIAHILPARGMFDALDGSDSVKTRCRCLLENLLSQEESLPGDFPDKLAEYYADYILPGYCVAISPEAQREDTRENPHLEALISLLRIKKFLLENGGEF